MGFLVGGAYAGPMRKALNAYRKKLRPGKGATVAQMLKSLDALDPGARAQMGEKDRTNTKARKMVAAAIKKTFHAADGRPLSKLRKAELVALASVLEANIQGKAQDFGPEPNEFAGAVPAINPRHRERRKDRGVARPTKRKVAAYTQKNRPKKRAPSEYNLFVGRKIKEIKAEVPDMPHKMAFSEAVRRWNASPEARAGKRAKKRRKKKQPQMVVAAELDEGADALLGLAQADDVDEFGRSNSLRGNGMMSEVTKKMIKHAPKRVRKYIPNVVLDQAGEGLTSELLRYMPESAMQYVPQHLRQAISARGGFTGSGPGYKFSD